MMSTAIATLALAASLTAALNSSNVYTKVASYSGSSFFSNFDTFTGPDPTQGFVDYVSMPTAVEQNLTAFIWYEYANRTNAYIGVDYRDITTATQGRQSVRLMSKEIFSVGMLTVIDVLHAPTGPGVWPAVWLLANATGVTWPTDGEQDIIEWVNDATSNSMTLHTAPGCSVKDDPSMYQGNLSNTDCNSGNGDDGCSITAPNNVSSRGQILSTAGEAFNAQDGGVYVHEWTSSGVSVWLFPRNNTPADLAAGNPNPSTWTEKPLARFSGTGCNFCEALQHMQLIINIDICGQWAGMQWDAMGMANKTGVPTCDAFAASQPEAFKDAFFDFAGIDIFSSGAKPQTATYSGTITSRGKRDTEGGVEIQYIDNPYRELKTNVNIHRHATHHGQVSRAHLRGTGEHRETVQNVRRAASPVMRSEVPEPEVVAYLIAAGFLTIAAAFM